MSPLLTLDDLPVGRAFPPYRYAVTEPAISSFVEATGCVRPPVPYAPGMLVAVYASLVDILRPLSLPPGLIHAAQRYEFHAPIRIGDQLETRLAVAERFERRDLEYVVLATETRTASGAPVSSGVSRIAWGA